MDDGLQASTQYQIRIVENQTAISGLSATGTGAGTTATDNNGVDQGSYISTATFTSPAAGENLTYDFGF